MVYSSGIYRRFHTKSPPFLAEIGEISEWHVKSPPPFLAKIFVGPKIEFCQIFQNPHTTDDFNKKIYGVLSPHPFFWQDFGSPQKVRSKPLLSNYGSRVPTGPNRDRTLHMLLKHEAANNPS